MRRADLEFFKCSVAGSEAADNGINNCMILCKSEVSKKCFWFLMASCILFSISCVFFILIFGIVFK